MRLARLAALLFLFLGHTISVSAQKGKPSPYLLMPPSIYALSVYSGAPGTTVVITGESFGSTKGSSTVKFNGTLATTSAWSATSITASVPASATTGPVVVRVGGMDSDGPIFTVTGTLSITGISPQQGVVGSSFTITGTAFGASQGSSLVKMGTTVMPIGSWSDTSITVTVPPASGGNVTVTVGGSQSNALGFFVYPYIESLSPAFGREGDTIAISGYNFGKFVTCSQVTFNGQPTAILNNSNSTLLNVQVPAGTSTGPVIVGGSYGICGEDFFYSNPVNFTILPPTVTGTSPSSGGLGSLVTISGSGFGSSGTVRIGGVVAATSSWSNNQIQATVPDGLTPGAVSIQVEAASGTSNSVSFTITQPLLVNPSEVALLVGEKPGFQVLDSAGTELTGITWAPVDAAIAELDSADPTSINALALGETKIRAFSGNQTGYATVKVVGVAGYQFPAGTVRLSSPPLGTGFVTNVVQSRKVDEDTPAFYVQEKQGSLERIRGFMEDGRQKWAYPGFARLIAPDNAGGVVAQTPSGFVTIGKDGNTQTWQASSAGVSSFKYAIHPNGTAFLVRLNGTTQYELVGVDTSTGQQTISVNLPRSTITSSGLRSYFNPVQNRTYQICDPSASGVTYALASIGQYIVASDGNTYFPMGFRNVVQTANCTPANGGDGLPAEYFGTYDQYSWDSRIEVRKINAEGVDQTPIVVATDSGSGTGNPPIIRGFQVGSITIPDGQGGVVFPGTDNDVAQWIYRAGGNRIAAPFPVQEMLLGENSTLFVATNAVPGGQYAAMSLATGAVAWSKTGNVHLVAALNDGSVLVQDNALTLVDMTGSVFSFSGGVDVSTPRYIGGDLWVASTANGFAVISDGPAENQSQAGSESGSGLPPTWGPLWFAEGPFSQLSPFNSTMPIVERPPTNSNGLLSNYNAIELATTLSPQQVFDLYLRTFVNKLINNPIASVVSTNNVDGIGDDVRFEMRGWKGYLQDRFTVRVKRYEPNMAEPEKYLFSIVTMSDHPLAGWRYWRVYRSSPSTVVIETGAVDKPFTLGAKIGNVFLKDDQIKMWKEFMNSIKQLIPADRTTNPEFGDDVLNGKWGVRYEENLVEICGPGPGGFCRP